MKQPAAQRGLQRRAGTFMEFHEVSRSSIRSLEKAAAFMMKGHKKHMYHHTNVNSIVAFWESQKFYETKAYDKKDGGELGYI